MKRDCGFSLLELVIAIAFLGVVSAMAAPLITDVMDGMRLNSTARELERELQMARMKSVQTNSALRVRTNCPAVGQYRIVEVLGPAQSCTVTNTNLKDTASNRCSLSVYPYPADADLATEPNYDGPVRNMYPGTTVNSLIVEFHPDGTACQVSGSGSVAPITTSVSMTVTKNLKTRSVTINGLGKIQLQ